MFLWILERINNHIKEKSISKKGPAIILNANPIKYDDVTTVTAYVQSEFSGS